MSRREEIDLPDSRRASARKRRRAYSTIRLLFRRGVIDYRERDRLCGEIARRYSA